MTIDFSQDIDVSVTDNSIKSISALAMQQLSLEQQLKEAQSRVDLVAEELRRIQETDLPNAMLEAGVSEFTLATGEEVTIKPDIYPSIPKNRQKSAFAWLRQHDHGSIIKNEIAVAFGKGQDDEAVRLLEELLKHGYQPSKKESIHFQTLKAFIKEYMANPENEDLPEDLFNVHEVRKAIIKMS